MKLFDGVTVNPNNLSPTLQGLLAVATLFAGTLVEADKERQRRAARAKEQVTTLEEVMEQSGLDLPRLEEALAKLMGGSPEAKEAASFIVKAPDPAKLLQQFAQQFTAACPGSSPIATPPPTVTETSSAAPPPGATAAPPAGRPRPAQFRPEFTREGMEAANAAPRPRPKPAQFRPEFTREGMEAAKSAVPATAASVPATAPSSPQATSTDEPPATSSPAAASIISPPPPAASSALTSPSPAPASSEARVPTLSDALARRLAARDRRIAAHQAELVTRVRCVEAELALLREEMQELQRTKDCPVVFLVPSAEPLSALSSEDMTSPPSGMPDSADRLVAEAPVEADTGATTIASATTAPVHEASIPADPPVAHDLPEPGIDVASTDPAQVIELREQTPPAPEARAATVQDATTTASPPGNSADSEPPPAPAATAAPFSNANTTTSETDGTADREAADCGISPPTADEKPLPPPVSEADLVQAVEMLDEFSERTEAHYIQEIEHVKGLEGDVKLLRALVARELVTRKAASHG